MKEKVVDVIAFNFYVGYSKFQASMIAQIRPISTKMR